MTTNEALANYDAKEDDVIKSKDAFALYDPSAGWIGDLEVMRPGNGYLPYRSSESNTSFRYPNEASSISRSRSFNTNQAVAAVDNSIHTQYSDNTSIVAHIDGIELTDSDTPVQPVKEVVGSLL